MSEKLIQQHCVQFDHHHRLYCRFNGNGSVEDPTFRRKTHDLGAIAVPAADSGSRGKTVTTGITTTTGVVGSGSVIIGSVRYNDQGLPSRRTLPGQTSAASACVTLSRWPLFFCFCFVGSLKMFFLERGVICRQTNQSYWVVDGKEQKKARGGGEVVVGGGQSDQQLNRNLKAYSFAFCRK